MIGIEAIGSYVPEQRIDNVGRAREFDCEVSFVRDKLGFEALARKAPTEETSDLCVKAFEHLRSRVPLSPDAIDYVVVCTQNPDGAGLPHTSALVHQKLGMTHDTAAFDISLGCSGYVYSLCVSTAFMAAQGLRKGLVFTADPYSKVLDMADRNTELLFADAATCTLLGENPLYRPMKSRFATDGSQAGAIAVDPQTSKLKMNGNSVFMFTMKTVPKQIEECLRINHLTETDLDIILLHQGSKYITDNMTKRMGFPREKTPFMAREIGNTVSSTIPLMLERIIDQGHRHILICGFGVGLSWSTTILEKVTEKVTE